MSEVISHFKAVNGDEGFGEWEVDQVDVKLFPHLGVIRLIVGQLRLVLQWAMPLQTMQVILSNAILRPDQQLCSLPKENHLWTRLTKKYQICRKLLLRRKNNSEVETCSS